MMEAYFDELAASVDRALRPGEAYTLDFDAEQTDFVRMNRGKVRQPGHVEQRYLDLRLLRGARHASHLLSLTGNLDTDRQIVGDALVKLRDVIPDLPEDPHLLVPETVASSRSERSDTMPAAETMVDALLTTARGHDLVGMLAAGPVYCGFANSQGQRNWHATTTFNLQWSLYHRADKAVKSSYTGLAWDGDVVAAKMRAATEQLALISRPPKVLPPGRYRAYLPPAALQEVADMLEWGGFSARALETQQSPLAKMRASARLDPRVSMSEDIGTGVAPNFQ